MAEGQTIDRDAIRATGALIHPYVRRTPVLEAATADFGLAGGALSFKLECLQHTGSFKPRGAFANLLARSVPAAGVIAASGGNHGAAVAFAAARLGVPATIFVPSITSPAKLARIKQYGAELVVGGASYAEALEASQARGRETGALAIHAYDAPETLLGQGTVGLEIEEQEPTLDTLLVAVGGGGLIGGIAAWYAGRVRLVAVEPAAAPTLAHAFAAGQPVAAPVGGVAADSLGAREVGHLMFPIARRYVDPAVVLVTDEEIRASQRALWDVLRIAVEPGGATAFAALLSRRFVPRANEHVGVLVCGANTTEVTVGGT